VHVCARVAALADPSDVLVSQTVKDLVAGSRLTFDDAGEDELKGDLGRWYLYRVSGLIGEGVARSLMPHDSGAALLLVKYDRLRGIRRGARGSNT
jgi:hypothetical protein